MDHWQQVSRICHDVPGRAEEERAAFLHEVCGDDEALRREVESLLAQERSAEGFLSVPAVDVAEKLIHDESYTSMIGKQVVGYQILSLLGTGGMREVYRARDTKLRRDVAIKVLPSFFANDPDRLARFAHEARLLAALNHPHIATIHGFEEADGVRALVMELGEGPTLAEKLAHGSRRSVKAGLPLSEALKIGGQIAEAVEAAHKKGVIHRDLKPANIKLGHDGNVKVLDFGLAKAFSSDSAGSNLSRLPTITVTELQAGAIVGTPAYMSPEQARGQAIDKRTDIWGFGCVLYEMLTGRAVFPGETISDTIAAILEREPEWSALPAHTPAGIRQLLRRCLDKDPNRRLHDIADARIEIDDVQSDRQQDRRVAPAPAGSRRRLAWASALALITLIAAAIGMWALRPVPTAPEVRFEINTPPTVDPSLAISPDGLKIIFVARSAGQSQLWLRSLDSPSARPLPGTERASSPFWSPDSRSIGFFADEKLKRMDIAGGSIQTLASALVAFGGAWNSDGTIVFSTNPGRPIVRVSAGGGESSAATRFESPQQSHSSPRFLPDGRHFLFFVTGTAEARGVYIGQLDGLDTKRVFDADAPAVYAATGHLLFIREGKLLAQDFDPDRLELRGDPFPMAEHVTAATMLSASVAGPIVYRTASEERGQRQLVWVDRSGRELDKVVYPDAAAQGPSLSLDGRRVAVFRLVNGNMDIWSYETSRRAWDRITFDPGDDIYPLWSPDGTRIVFGSARKTDDVMNLYRKLLSAPPGSEELVLSTQQGKFPMDWSADGRFLLYDSFDPKRGTDIWALPLEGDRKPFAVVQTDFSERLAQFSPDGTWIAYQSDKTGHFEIYLRPFPGPGGDSRASTAGGAQARWNRNGRELFYIAADDRLMAVPIRFSSDGKTVEFGSPLGLFATSVGSTAFLTYRQQYVVSPDGQSFVMNSVLGEASASPITVILNWKPKLSR